MPLKEILLPAMGEGITDATIIRWLIAEGENVKKDQPIVEIATDKVDSEIVSPAEGILKKIICLAGSIPKIGETIALLAEEGDENAEIDLTDNSQQPDYKSFTKHIVSSKKIRQKRSISEKIEVVDNRELPFIPPYVRLVTSKLNIDLYELAQFSELKPNEALNKRHVEEFVQQRDYVIDNQTDKKTQSISKFSETEVELDLSAFGSNIEIQEMSRMRKLIAKQMVRSSNIIPHVTSYIEADITELVQWRDKNKEKFEALYKTRLTLTPLFVTAIVQGLKKYPEINTSLSGDNLIIRKDINIGMATVLPDKNLIVPVIKNADSQNLQGLAMAVNDLSARARTGELLPQEIMGSTFTFTNIGVFGTLTGTPIINYPEAAIMAIGAINKKPYVVKTEQGNSIGIRDIVILSLAYDHRIIDGSLGGLFLKEVATALTTLKNQLPEL